MIKIKIEKLGRVVESEIEIAPLMVFSGESGMGKSYLALLVHYFYDVLIVPNRRLAKLFEDLGYDYKEMAKKFHNEGTAFVISKKDLERWMEQDAISYLRYMLNSDTLEGHIHITLPDSVPERFVYTYKEEITGIVNNEDVDIILGLSNIRYRVNQSAINDETPYARLLSAFLIECLFGNHEALESTFIMPPSRGPILSENVVANSGMYKDFSADMAELSNVASTPRKLSSSLLEQLFSIMEGEVKKENNRFIYQTNGISIPISAAAASIREIAPLQILAKKWDITKTAILIEEPEAHLHPTKQRMMADIIGCMHKAGAFIHLTTHSDYFLRRINELILFQRYADKHSTEEVNELAAKTGIHPSFSVSPDSIAAYIIERQKDGTSKIVAQNMQYGVPFTAFGSAVKESMRINDIFEEIFEQ